jgi:hypothetical protein
MLIATFFHQIEYNKSLANIAKAQPTLLTGDIGIGKTHLLKQVQSQLSHVIYIESPSPPKSVLLEILYVLHANDDLEIAGMEVEYLSRPELRKKINRLSIRELLLTAQENLSGRNYILVLDHLERLTPSAEDIIATLMECATVVGAANKRKPSLKKLWWRFEKIEVPPLTRKESKQLLWSIIDKDAIDDTQLFEKLVLNQASGNPLSIVELSQKARREENLTADNIRQLRHQAGTRYIDITPVFFIIGFFAVASRFVALGMNSTELYILAAVASSFFMGLRYFLYRSMRSDE